MDPRNQFWLVCFPSWHYTGERSVTPEDWACFLYKVTLHECCLTYVRQYRYGRNSFPLRTRRYDNRLLKFQLLFDRPLTTGMKYSLGYNVDTCSSPQISQRRVLHSYHIISKLTYSIENVGHCCRHSSSWLRTSEALLHFLSCCASCINVLTTNSVYVFRFANTSHYESG